MAGARAYTAAYDTVQKAALAALADPDGLTVYFRLDRYPSPEACASASRSFQTVFSSLRARARRLSERRIGDSAAAPPRDTLAQGPFDKLVCQRLPLPNGEWYVSLVPSHVIMSGLDIVSNSTGQPLTAFGAKQDERTALAVKMAEGKLTAGEWDRLLALDRLAFPGEPDLLPSHYPRPGGPQPTADDPFLNEDIGLEEEEEMIGVDAEGEAP